MKVKQSTYIIIFNQLKFRGGMEGQPFYGKNKSITLLK